MKKLSGQQLRNIIAEAVDNILNEEVISGNLSQARNRKVRAAGYNAQFEPRGNGQESDVDVERKHLGGNNVTISTLYADASEGDANAAIQFFKAIKHIPALDRRIQQMVREFVDNTHRQKYGKRINTKQYL